MYLQQTDTLPLTSKFGHVITGIFCFLVKIKTCSVFCVFYGTDARRPVPRLWIRSAEERGNVVTRMGTQQQVFFMCVCVLFFFSEIPIESIVNDDLNTFHGLSTRVPIASPLKLGLGTHLLLTDNQRDREQQTLLR